MTAPFPARGAWAITFHSPPSDLPQWEKPIRGINARKGVGMLQRLYQLGHRRRTDFLDRIYGRTAQSIIRGLKKLDKRRNRGLCLRSNLLQGTSRVASRDEVLQYLDKKRYTGRTNLRQRVCSSAPIAFGPVL